MKQLLRILFVEDLSTDQELAERQLRADGMELTALCVDTRAAFLQALVDFKPDLIISDYSMPTFDGMLALKLVQEQCYDVPFVILTGSMNEDTAVACLKAGADDYVLKDHLHRLPFAVREALKRFQDRKEKVLAEQRIRLQSTALNSAANAILITDSNGTVEWINSAFTRLTGFTEEDVLGNTLHALFSGVQDQTYFKNLWETIVVGRVWRGEVLNRRKDGSLYAEEETITPLLDPNGNVSHFISIKVDITERKEAEKTIQRHRNVLQLFVEHAPAAIAMFDNEMRYISVSQRFLTDYELDDLKIQDVIGQSHYAIFPEMPDRWKTIHQRCLAGATERCDEDPFPRASGKLDWVRWEIRPWYETTGNIGGLLLFSEVITERKRAQEQIQTQLYRLKSLHAIDQAIAASFDIKVVLNVLIEAVISSLNVDAADVLLFDNIFNTLDLAVGNGFRSRRREKTIIPLGKNLPGRVAVDHKTLYVTDLKQYKNELIRSWLLTDEGFVTYIGVPLYIKGILKGVLEIFHRAPLNRDHEWLEFLETLAGQAAIAIDNIQTYEGLRRANLHLTVAYDATIAGWSRAMDLRDKETEDHTVRVTDMTLRLAREMGIAEKEIVHIRRGCLLHDIGKLGVPDEILRKPGKLTEEEWVIMRQHPQLAFEMIAPIDYLRPALDIPYCHHEKWDGTGYPRGLDGGRIPIAARIFAVVDVWDALRSDRPYRSAWSEEKVLENIRSQSGIHFDPKVAEIFLRMVKE